MWREPLFRGPLEGRGGGAKTGWGGDEETGGGDDEIVVAYQATEHQPGFARRTAEGGCPHMNMSTDC